MPTDLPIFRTTRQFTFSSSTMSLFMEKEVRDAISHPDFDLICGDDVVKAHLFVLRSECGHISSIVEFDSTCRSLRINVEKEILEEALGHIYGYFFTCRYANKGVIKAGIEISLHWKHYSVFRILQADALLETRYYYESCGLLSSPPTYDDIIRGGFSRSVEFLLNPAEKCPDANLLRPILKEVYAKLLTNLSYSADPIGMIDKLDNVKFDHEILTEAFCNFAISLRENDRVVRQSQSGIKVIRMYLDGIYYFIFTYGIKNPDLIDDIDAKFFAFFPKSGYLYCQSSALQQRKHWVSGCLRGFHAMYERIFDITAEDAFVSDMRNGLLPYNEPRIKPWKSDMVRRYNIDQADIAFDIMIGTGSSTETTMMRLPRTLYVELRLEVFESKK